MPKALTVWITTICGKFLKQWEYQTTLPATWEICMQVKKQQLKPDMEQKNGSKLGKEYVKAVYCHPAYLDCMRQYLMWNAGLDKAQAGIKIAWRNTNKLRYADRTNLMSESEEKLKGKLKCWLKMQHSKNEDHSIGSHHFMANRWGNNGNSERLFSWAPVSL